MKSRGSGPRQTGLLLECGPPIVSAWTWAESRSVFKVMVGFGRVTKFRDVNEPGCVVSIVQNEYAILAQVNNPRAFVCEFGTVAALANLFTPASVTKQYNLALT